MENYHILERIGEGSFGKVYRGRRKFTGQIVALKFVSKRNKTDRDLQNLRQEINILRRLNHCNIIAIMDSFETDGEICMVTEYGQGELFQVLGDDQHLPESEVRHITIQLLQALQVLHQKRIIHRDMKPQNILIGSKQQIKVCDFGFARAISNDSSMLTSIKGTPLYMAPELVQEKPYNCTVDLWSLGVILYELAVGAPPFYTDKIVSLVQMIIREPVKFPDTMSPAFRSFLSGLLTKDPKRRLSWPDILHHPFVVETPEELQKRLKLEQEFRQLPRFFTTEDHVPVDPTQQLKPSVERLRNSGEWKICDPQTGRQVEADAVAVAEGKQLEEHRPLVTQVVVEPEALPQPVVPPLKCGDAFLQAHEEFTLELKGKRGVAVLEVPLWPQLWDAYLDIDAAAVTQECIAAACSDMVVLYKALAAVMKNADCLASVDPVLQARACVHKFLVGFLQHDMADNGACADLLYQTVRCCTMFTNLMNSVERHVPNYRDLCSSDVQLVTNILQLPNEQLGGAISRALKWLGSMLDRARSLTDLLEEVHASGVIEALCQVLASSSGQRSPGGTSTKAARDNGLYAVFALATFVHPDGSKWGPLHPFPAMTLRHIERPSANTTADVRYLYKLRVKIHSEVTTQLLRNGLHELIALLNDELKTRLARRQANDDTDADDAEEPDQSTVSCVIKILLHACRSSSPLSRKIMTSRSSRSSVVPNDDIISILLALVQSGTLHDIEVYFAIEFLVVLMRRQVLTKQHVWLCAKALYPIFASSPDVGLLSASCTYFADVLEGGNMDVSALSRDEQVLGLAASHQDVWDLVVYGILSDTCRASILRLFQHQAFSDLAPASRAETLQVLACYNVRAQGLVDAAVVLLLRIAAKAMSHVTSSDGAPTEHRALDGFVALFEAPVTWRVLCQFLDTSGDDLLSPWGLFCFLKLMRMIREMPTSDDATIELALNEHLVPQLVNLLDTTHMESLLQWPEVVGGGSSAVKALIHAIVKVLGIPFMHNLSDELLVATQTMLYDAHCVDKLLVVLHFVFTAHDFGLDASVLELPISFLSRLVTSSEHFGIQFVQAHGMETIKACGMLDRRISSPPLVIDTLLILSQLARSSPNNYACILEADLVAEFRDLVLHDEAMVRAKALNCIGNLCRHSTLFYDRFSEPIADKHGALSVLDGVVNGLSDADGYVRRFACFAIGNAAFHNDRLYHALRLAIPPLVQNLRDGDEKTRSNAAGALGNLVRNSDTLCNDMCRVHAPRELLALARTDPSVSSRRIVLFSLGNFCSYAVCVASMKRDEPDFITQLEWLYDDVTADDVAKKNIRRILSKIDGLGLAGPSEPSV